MKNFIIAHARPVFWVLALPACLITLWCATWMEAGAVAGLYCLMVVWIMAAGWGVNSLAWLACRPALRALDENCDPEPLLELCRAVLSQNPKSLYFRVYEGWAFALLGRREEAEQSAALAQGNPRLWRNLPLLLVWSAALAPEDPRLERVEETAERRLRRLKGKRRTAAALALALRRDTAQLGEAPDDLEARLLQTLDRAACTREQVAAHLALGAYYVRRGDPSGEEHLSFVLAHGNKLCARVQAERLLCTLPAKPGG